MKDPTKTNLKSPEAIGCLAEYRDNVTKEEKDLRSLAEHDLSIAKEIYHSRIIEANRLARKARMIQSCVTQEMQQILDEKNRLEEEYSVHSPTSQYFQDLIEKSIQENQDS